MTQRREELISVFVAGRTVVSTEVLTDSLTRAGFHVLAAAHDWTQLLSEESGADASVTVIEAGLDQERELRLSRRIKAARPHTQIVIFGLRSERDAVEFAAAGASGYVLRDEDFERLLEVVRAAQRKLTLCTPKVGEEVLSRLRALGRRQADQPDKRRLSQLTARELEILELVAAGLLNKEISHKLDITLSTVKNHVHNILTKLGAENRRQASRLGARSRYH